MREIDRLTDEQRARLDIWCGRFNSRSTKAAYYNDVGTFLIYCETDRKTVVSEANQHKIGPLVTKWAHSKPNLSPCSVARKISAVRSYLVYCGLRTAADEATRPKLKNRRAAILTPEYVDMLLRHNKLTVRARALIGVLAFSPMSLVDVLELKIKDLDTPADKIPGPYSEEITEALKVLAFHNYGNQVTKCVASPVFVNYIRHKLSRQGVWQELRNASLLIKPYVVVNACSLKTAYILRVLAAFDNNQRRASEACGVSLDVVNRLYRTAEEQRKKDASGKDRPK